MDLVAAGRRLMLDFRLAPAANRRFAPRIYGPVVPALLAAGGIPIGEQKMVAEADKTTPDKTTAQKGVILSGMRPTGRLHLGNYLGALENWVALQQEYRCIYTVVDIHALTTIESPTDVSQIQPNILEMVLDWLAAGVDPEQSTVFVQSQVPQVMSLHTLLSMVTPLGWLMRVPTFKEKVRQMEETEESVNYGLVG